MSRPIGSGPYTVLIRRLRAGEQIPLRLGKPSQRSWRVIHSAILDMKPLRIADATNPENLAITLRRWIFKSKDLYPLLKTAHVVVRRDEDNKEVVYVYFQPLREPL